VFVAVHDRATSTELVVVTGGSGFVGAHTTHSASVELIGQILTGALPGTSGLRFGVVDVRDVADLLVRVMVSREAVGERFLATSGQVLTTARIAALLRDWLGESAHRVTIADSGPIMKLWCGSGSVNDRDNLRQQDQRADATIDDPMIEEHRDELADRRARPEVERRS
jgi:nucleoside-diphosphate-sugar epimerase